MTKWDVIAAAVFASAVFGYRYVTGDFSVRDLLSYVVPAVWTICPFGIYFSIIAGHKLRKELLAEFDNYRPSIHVFGELPERRKPSQWPVAIVTLSMCGIFILAAIGASVLVPAPVAIVESSPDASQPPQSNGPEVSETLNVSVKVAPYVIAKRGYQRFADGSEVRWTDYGLGAIVRLYNTGQMPRQISRLDVLGEASIDCGSYDASMGIEKLDNDPDAVVMLGDFIGECEERKPFYELSWVSYPIGDNRVEPNGGERFVRFRIMPPVGTYRVKNGPFSSYVGFASEYQRPALLTTVPHVFDIIRFTIVGPQDSRELSGPVLRPEVRDGLVFFRVLIGEEGIKISSPEINDIHWTLENRWNELTPQDLFFGSGDPYYDRAFPVPSGRDPAMR